MTRRSFLASMFLLFCEFRLNLRALADEDNSGYWYSGIIHVHSNFSDGIRQPKVVMSKAISSQASFLIVTDHYEQIDSLKKHLYQTTKNHGFSNYLDFFRSTSALIVLAGAEITAKQGDHNTHTLALGKIHQDSVLGAIQGQDNSQQAIVSRIKELGMLSVAAHPSVITAGSLSVSDPIEPTNYFYDRDNSRDLTGIEFGNEDPDRGKITFVWYLSLSKSQDVFVTFGNDSHFPEEKGDSERWQRKTYVFACGGLSEGSLVDALKSGHSYGSRDNIQLQSLSFIPGFAYQNVTEARIQFRVRIPEKTRSVKKVNLYRDGVATAVASVSIPKGSAFYDCVLFDPGISGRHTYIVALDDMSLVTSPFRLDIRAPKAKTGDWTTDLFEQAVVRVSKNKPGVGKTEWLEKDEWPVADSSQRFTAPSVLDICAIFHYSGQEKNPPVAFNPGKVGKLVTMPSLPNQLNITVVVTDQRGNKVIEASPGGFYGGNWRYAIISTTAEFRQKGTYKVEVRSQKTDKVIGTSTFIIK